MIVQFGGQTPLRLARGARGGRRAAARHAGRRDRPRRGPRPLRRPAAPARHRPPALRDRALGRRGGGDRRATSASRCWCGPPTCSAAGRWRSATRPRTSRAYLEANVKADQEHPLLLDRFLENAIEVDVDALGDGEDVCVAGIMQHVEEAGVHSGDSACVIPPMSLGEEMLEEIRATTRADRARAGRDRADQHPVRGRRRRALRDRGQPARLAHGPVRLQGDRRAAGEDRLPADARRGASPTRTCPRQTGDHVSVKEAVLPFARFAGADSVLGPEMKSTGEVMGIAARLPDRLRQGAGRGRRRRCRPRATVFITVTDTDKAAATQIAARFHDLGFEIDRDRRHRAGDLGDGGPGARGSTRSARARRTSST